jgi:hypothetical protein
MFISKVLGGSFLLTNSYHFAKNSPVRAECETRTGTEQAAADLDKIFAAADGMPPDPEEIQEMMLKAQGKTIRYDTSPIFNTNL